MEVMRGFRQPGVFAALGAALLFGGGTPFAKWLLGSTSPWLLAGLLYLGSGVGLTIYRRLRHSSRISLPAGEGAWLAGAIAAGGIVAPVLLMFGLSRLPASSTSLLLNAEGVFTALLAWFVFHENFDRRIALGMLSIVAGAIVLSWSKEFTLGAIWPQLAVLTACFAWGLDNNFTRKVSLADATWIASIKGCVAGVVNLALAFVLGASWPAPANITGALIVGCLAYGVSLAMFVVGLRNLGTARTAAYFSVAPFFGALLAVLVLGEHVTFPLALAGALMALGVWLHLTELHTHEHTHEAMEHEHEHSHDEHHRHSHDGSGPVPKSHSHWHRHEPLTHSHAHYPDAHHRHGH